MEMDPMLSLPTFPNDWLGRQGPGRGFCDSCGEGINNSLVELLGSELSLRGSERPPGTGHSLDTGREAGRKVRWAVKAAQQDEEVWAESR